MPGSFSSSSTANPSRRIVASSATSRSTVVIVPGVRAASSRPAAHARTESSSGSARASRSLPDGRRVREVAAPDHRRQSHAAGRRVDLGAVDDVAVVEHRVVGGLPEPRGEGRQGRVHPDLVGPGLVVGEREPEELVAELVAPRSVLGREPGPAQRRQGSVHGGLRAGRAPCSARRGWRRRVSWPARAGRRGPGPSRRGRTSSGAGSAGLPRAVDSMAFQIVVSRSNKRKGR